MATSLDGKISAAEGTQTWLTSEASKVFVHRQRSIYDAVLIGANTVNIDNPRLTVREAEGRNPIRIILDGNLSSMIDSEIFNPPEADKESKTLILCSANADEKKKNNFIKRCIGLIEFETRDNNELNLKEVLKKLSELKITSLFVEGGGQVFARFISQRLFDEIIVLKAPVTLNRGVDIISIDTEEDLYLFKKEQLDKDILLSYKLKAAEHVYRNN